RTELTSTRSTRRSSRSIAWWNRPDPGPRRAAGSAGLSGVLREHALRNRAEDAGGRRDRRARDHVLAGAEYERRGGLWHISPAKTPLFAELSRPYDPAVAVTPDSERPTADAALPQLYRDLAEIAEHAAELGAEDTLDDLERERAVLAERWHALDAAAKGREA